VTVLVREAPSDGVVLLRLNRPERLNALNEALVGELSSSLATIARERDARVVVLTGAGRGFCAGIDVRDFGPSALNATDPAIDRMRFQETMAALPQAVRALPQPVIAAVNGPAVGGGLALCLASDIRLCAASASFGNAAILLGLSGAEMGMSYYLPRIVGLSVAADWMLTGRTVPAEEALQRGLVSELVRDDLLLDRALERASQIAAHPPLAAQMTKRALQVNADAPNLFSALELENRNQVITHATDEAASARQRWAAKT
jgi:enoyl-CoA hydratase/carnithine racemase